MIIKEIGINEISPDPKQPRTSISSEQINELAESIKTEGIINFVEIDNSYKIITGELRWRAAKKAGLKKIHCKIISISDKERFRRQVVENIQHCEMNAIDTANAFKKVMDDYKIDKMTLARMIGKSHTTISNYLRLLEEPEDIQEDIRQKKVSPRAMITLSKKKSALGESYPEVRKKVIEEKMPISQIENLAKLPAVSFRIRSVMLSCENVNDKINTIDKDTLTEDQLKNLISIFIETKDKIEKWLK